MNYEEFKQAIIESFISYMPERYRGMKLDIRPVEKVNMTLDGISIIPEGDTKITSTMYINDMYEHYQHVDDLSEVLQAAANNMVRGIEEPPIQMPNMDYEIAKDNIVYQFINTEQNKEMLQNMPSRAYNDLSIIYRWVVSLDDQGMHSTLINNALAVELGLSEEQLYELSVVNTQRILPPVVKTMNEVVREMFMKEGMPAEIVDMMVPEMEADQTMYVISNIRGVNGSIAILCDDMLYDLAERVGTDLYIMPSSIHEVIAVSANMADSDAEKLAAMVTEVNADQVALNERLSNQVYRYDRTLRQISLATDTPNKKLG